MESLWRLWIARRHGLAVLDDYDDLCRIYHHSGGETRRNARKLAREVIARDGSSRTRPGALR